MSILFEKMTDAAREVAEAKLRDEGILAPDAPLEYAFEVTEAERPALEKARAAFDAKIGACKDDVSLAKLAVEKARRVQSEIDAISA